MIFYKIFEKSKVTSDLFSLSFRITVPYPHVICHPEAPGERPAAHTEGTLVEETPPNTKMRQGQRHRIIKLRLGDGSRQRWRSLPRSHLRCHRGMHHRRLRIRLEVQKSPK